MLAGAVVVWLGLSLWVGFRMTGRARPPFVETVPASPRIDVRAFELTTLDGEGGYTVWGKLMPAADSAAARALPIGLAHHVKLKRDIPEGRTVSWEDVEYDANSEAVKVRREMERVFGQQGVMRPKSVETTDEHG